MRNINPFQVNVLEGSELTGLLTRIGASRHFAKAPRLRGFLEFVCLETAAGRAEQINEQVVGRHVFGRPAEYDSSSDNIVRVEARELRKRLQAYFADEGAAEPVLIVIPKGQYAASFEPRSQPLAVEPVSAVAEDVAPVGGGTKWEHWLVGVLAVGVVILSATSLHLYRELSARPAAPAPLASSPLAASFWGRIYDPRRPATIVLPDSNLSLLQDLRSEVITMEEYSSGRYLAKLREGMSAGGEARIFGSIAARHYTGLGDVNAMAHLMMLNRRQSPVQVRYARDLKIQDLKSQNLIMLGSRRSNPWESFLQSGRRFAIDHDEQINRAFLLDREPEDGSDGRYFGGRPGEGPRDAYGLIVSMPNLGAGHVLIVAGSGTQGTEAAGEFLASEQRLEEVLKKIGWKAGDPLPSFEIALKAVVVGGTTTSSSIFGLKIGQSR